MSGKKGTRYVVELNGELKIIGLWEYERFINRGIDMKYLGVLQHVRKTLKEPPIKKNVLRLFEQNIDMIANKGKENCLNNFKTLVYNRL
jgi:hypothetical protein